MSTSPELPRSGDVLYLDARSGPIFSVNRATVRVVRLMEEWNQVTCDEWCWLEVYQLNQRREAVCRRTVWVYLPGVVVLTRCRARPEIDAGKRCVDGGRVRPAPHDQPCPTTASPVISHRNAAESRWS